MYFIDKDHVQIFNLGIDARYSEIHRVSFDLGITIPELRPYNNRFEDKLDAVLFNTCSIEQTIHNRVLIYIGFINKYNQINTMINWWSYDLLNKYYGR